MATGMSNMSLHLVGIDRIRKRWAWILALGILLAVLGSFAFGYALVFTIASVWLFGWLMLVGGLLQGAHAFVCRDWGGFFIDLLAGVLYFVVGVMIIGNPAATAVALTLLIALFLIFGGIFRIAVAALSQFHNRGWLLLYGVVSLLLGISIWREWPFSGLWVIGMFVGIDMIFNGWTLIMLGLAARRIPAQ